MKTIFQGTGTVLLLFLASCCLATALEPLFTNVPIVDDIECVGGCKCNDAGGCKCFTKAHDNQCRCQNCTCKDEDK